MKHPALVDIWPFAVDIVTGHFFASCRFCGWQTNYTPSTVRFRVELDLTAHLLGHVDEMVQMVEGAQ